MAAKKSRRGRPPLEAGERRRHILSIRVRDETRQQLEKAAKEHDRSVSNEVEALIERSFDRRRLLQDVMEASYGAELAAVFTAMAIAARRAQLSIGFFNKAFGGPAAAGLRDPRTHSEVTKAVMAVLDELKPKGEPVPLVAEEKAGKVLVDGAADAREMVSNYLAGAYAKAPSAWVADGLSDLTASKGEDAP